MPHACITVVLMLLNCWSSPLICPAGLYGRQKHSGCAQGQPQRGHAKQPVLGGPAGAHGCCSALVLVLRAQPEHTKPQIPVFPAVSQGSELHAASRTTRRVVLISHFVHRFSTSAFLGQELLLRGIVWLRQLSAVRRDVNPLSHSPSEKLPHFFFVYVSKKVCILPWFFRIVMLKLYPLILADAINPSITWKQAEPQIQTVLYQVSHVCCSKHVLWYNTVYFCS